MFYYLSGFRDVFSPLNLFQYITFLAGGAFLTAPQSTALGVSAYLYLFPPNAAFADKVPLPYLKGVSLTLGWFYITFALLVMVGSSNAVNLTDGMDGLAVGTQTVTAITFAIF